MCRQVVKSGKWKSRCSGENIHLLYCGKGAVSRGIMGHKIGEQMSY